MWPIFGRIAAGSKSRRAQHQASAKAARRVRPRSPEKGVHNNLKIRLGFEPTSPTGRCCRRPHVLESSSQKSVLAILNFQGSQLGPGELNSGRLIGANQARLSDTFRIFKIWDGNDAF